MIQVEQQNENLYYWYFPDNMVWHDFDKQVDELGALLATQTHPISVVVFAERQHPPGDALRHLKHLFEIVDTHPHMQKFIIVNNRLNIIGRNLIQVTMQLAGNTKKVHLVTTEAEALTILNEVST